MENCCSSKCKSMKWLALGIILILIGYYRPLWNIGIVIGVFLILKAIWVTLMPACPYCSQKSSNSKSRRR